MSPPTQIMCCYCLDNDYSYDCNYCAYGYCQNIHCGRSVKTIQGKDKNICRGCIKTVNLMLLSTMDIAKIAMMNERIDECYSILCHRAAIINDFNDREIINYMIEKIKMMLGY